MLCKEIAERFCSFYAEAVVAPAIGGVILSQWVAYYLSKIVGHEVLSLYAEKTEDAPVFVIKRGYEKIIPRKRILLVEDVLTTGGSVKRVVDVVRSLGGEPVGLGVLCNRGNITPQDVGGIPKISALVNVQLESWEEAECPLCAQGVPINLSVGKGMEFMTRKEMDSK